ncbi:hypothetical protein OG909_32890 (plasmid) [Streptomyces sp. NBC_01754]|uniref:hypothetical protein n=1 Tax=Streptomyces sp. NBC_01754 TaxID=2975930 RepID=UPI002DD7D032|nr:hypothetical protein [Streptomyces sp. NBC_01754]WSC97103.1 hypothetical protein OG909_32890 [Streptomyces sp. NBC_01754]
MTTHRRPLGTGPAPASASVDNPGVSPGEAGTPTRASLAAERLPTVPAEDQLVPARPAGRRVLGAGPGTAGP